MVLALVGAACQSRTLDAVGAPPGVYRPNAGCVISEAGGSTCPLGLQWGFEDARDATEFHVDTPTTLSDATITCGKSYCGTGSLRLRASYRWPGPADADPKPNPRFGGLSRHLAQPVDLMGRELSFRVFVEQLRPAPAAGTQGIVTPVNAQIAFIGPGRYRIVWDGPLQFRTGWQTRGGVVAPGNTCCEDLPATTTAIRATDVIISVYLATSVRNGDQFDANIYFDEIGWQ
jgi:hypothetical protein